MKPRHFWWLVSEDIEANRGKASADLGKSDVRRLRRMMEKKQNELTASQS